MLLIQNKRVNWETYQIGIPGATAKDKENRRIPFNPEGRLAAILKRRAKLGPDAYVFGTANGEYQPELQTAWETLRLSEGRFGLRVGHNAVTEGLKSGCGGAQPAVLAAVEWGCMTPRVTSMSRMSPGVGVAHDARNPDGYSSRSASTGATLDARSAGSNDAASTVARDMTAAISSVRESPGAMP
jgi:hypothetical protein